MSPAIRSRSFRSLALGLGLCLVSACSSSPPGPDAAVPDRRLPDLAAAPDAALPDLRSDLAPPTHQCDLDDKLCLGWAQRRFCQDTAAGRRWAEETCAAGSGCQRGECAAQACSDECDLGDSQAGKSCALYDLKTQSWAAAAPATSRHDRARAYNEWLHRHGMVHGGVGNARFSDPPAYTQPVMMRGLVDSAIWTGTYLAAEALRLQVTGSAAARARVRSLVETLHLWFNVTGVPGLLARFAAPSGAAQPVDLDRFKCGSPWIHCNVSYQGTNYDYWGHISRDQYQGVMLGYALAYQALGPTEEPTRALIREDVLEFVEELMKERTVPLKLIYDGVALPTFPLTMRFAVVAPAEMDGGAAVLTYVSKDAEDSDWSGFQEFVPNLTDVLEQVPLIGQILPPIPRAGSAVMLASFFQVALLVSQGVPELAGRRAAIESFYLGNAGWGGNVDDWLKVAVQWTANEECGNHYYGNNITMEPLYNLARLETDPARRQIIIDDLLVNRVWQTFKTAKNSFFAFICLGNMAGPSPVEIGAALAQLDGFPPPPRVRLPVDLRSDPRYLPHDPNCADQVSHSTAVDVADRVVEDFIWQRGPWLLYDGGDLSQTYPGVDYLVAYWLGRQHDFITEDGAGRCLRWK